MAHLVLFFFLRVDGVGKFVKKCQVMTSCASYHCFYFFRFYSLMYVLYYGVKPILYKPTFVSICLFVFVIFVNKANYLVLFSTLSTFEMSTFNKLTKQVYHSINKSIN